MRDSDDWTIEERVFKNYLDTLTDDESWADQYLDDDDYMTREEMDLP